MNLLELLDFCGNLLDYDPTNPTYRDQLVSLLNDSQTRILTDRPWDFSQKDRQLMVRTDATYTGTFTATSAAVTGTWPHTGSTITPGSPLAGARVTLTDSAGNQFIHRASWVENGTTLYLDRPFSGVTGAYEALFQWRDIYLPSDAVTVQNVSDPSVGIPAKAIFLSKFSREDANLDPDLLGTIEAYLPSSSLRIRAPKKPRGVAVTAALAGQGTRTVNVYMVNVYGPEAPPYRVYRRDVSDGFESAFSQVQTFNLSDSETLTFTPETLPNTTGYYRRYYFTCPEAGIYAPVRIRNDAGQGGGVLTGVDTIPPSGGVTIRPDLDLNTLEGQPFQSDSIRYQFSQSAAYQSIQLYPHPSANQALNVRQLVNAPRMLEDQDAPIIPAAYAQIIAYAALESLCLKVANPALASVYARKKQVLYQGMEARYLQMVPRRIIKGTPTAGYRYVRNPFGKLVFTP